ncbi:MAG: putative shikimate-kinase [Frankiales bacterium]|nr:putative shikimate-kinase [Frankiales bacterium]
MKDKVLLLGMMGCGKSTVGAALSSRVGWPYLDNDVLLERTAGARAPEILAAQGDQALREAESRVLTVMLALPGPVIAGLPASVVLLDDDRARIVGAGAHVVWLRTSPAVLARRVGSGAGRPRLGNDPLTALRALGAERNTYFEEVADQVIDTDALPAGAIAKAIVGALDLDPV